MSLLNNLKNTQFVPKKEVMSLEEYLNLCAQDKTVYAGIAERMLLAIGEPEIVDTSTDSRLARIYANRHIRRYPAFKDFYGMEDTIDSIVGFFKHASQSLEEKKQILYLLGPVGSGKCERKDTKIFMSDGSLKNIQDVVVGDSVISLNEKGYIINKKVTQTFVIEPKEVVKVKTARGLEISSAPTHSYLGADGWNPVSTLKAGDFIATARKTVFGNKTYDKNLLKVIAYLIGDGYIGNKNNDLLTFTNFNDSVLEDFCDAVQNCGSEIAIQYNKRTKDIDYLRIKEGYVKTIKHKLNELGLLGTYSNTKFIPEFVFNLDKEHLSVFLSRLYATDGWASVSQKGQTEIGYCSVSKELTYQLVSLLSKYGIPARVNKKQGKLNGENKQFAYQVVINDRRSIVSFANNIGIFGKEDAVNRCLLTIENQDSKKTGSKDRIPKFIIRQLTETVKAHKYDGTSKIKDQLRTTLDNNKGCRREFVQECAKLETFKNLKDVSENDIYWDEITSIEYTSVFEEMYDFEVEDTHNYIAEGIISHNSSVAEKLKALVEEIPFYTLAIEKEDKTLELSPVYESPLGIFSIEKYAGQLETEFKIPTRYLSGIMSPWAVKRLSNELEGDITRFKVVKLYPSKLHQVAIAKTEPGDENNQDISSLVGKVDIRKLNRYSQNDPDCYSFSGALCKANQGIMEFVEMFKAPIKILNPLLTATQEGNYNGTEAIGPIPFQGMVLAHSNEAEWLSFKSNKANEAFIDRISLIKTPYVLAVSDEIKIYQKLVRNSSVKDAICAPKTLEMLAQFFILSRLEDVQHSSIYSKMKVYDGQNLKDSDPQAKSIQEYKDAAGSNEGMTGLSTRFAFKILSKVYNYDPVEVAANPIHLLRVLEDAIEKEDIDDEKKSYYLNFLQSYLKPEYAKFIEKEIQIAYLESYSDYGQNLFDRYIDYADHWVDDRDFRDPNTGEMYDREALNAELEKIEKSAEIVNPKEFRAEVVNYCLRYRAGNKGKNPSWTSYEKLRVVIEKKMFSQTNELLPVIAFGNKSSKEDERKHKEFVERMVVQGYTERQVRMLVEWFVRVRKSE